MKIFIYYHEKKLYFTKEKVTTQYSFKLYI